MTIGMAYFFRKQIQVAEIWVFPKLMVPQDGWFIMVPNPIKIIKMDDLGVPLFFGNTHICTVIHSEQVGFP